MSGTTYDDSVLRAFGFRIHARPKQGDAVWKKGAKTYTYVAAMEWCRLMLRCRIDELKGGAPSLELPNRPRTEFTGDLDMTGGITPMEEGKI